MPDAVIDASTTLAWLFGETGTVAMRAQLKTASFLAPWLWRVEVVNAMLTKERRKQITPAQSSRFFRVLEALSIEVIEEPLDRSMDQLALFARPHQLTSYDALYLELAMTTGCPLLTLDRNLTSAAARMGVSVNPPGLCSE